MSMSHQDVLTARQSPVLSKFAQAAFERMREAQKDCLKGSAQVKRGAVLTEKDGVITITLLGGTSLRLN